MKSWFSRIQTKRLSSSEQYCWFCSDSVGTRLLLACVTELFSDPYALLPPPIQSRSTPTDWRIHKQGMRPHRYMWQHASYQFIMNWVSRRKGTAATKAWTEAVVKAVGRMRWKAKQQTLRREKQKYKALHFPFLFLASHSRALLHSRSVVLVVVLVIVVLFWLRFVFFWSRTTRAGRLLLFFCTSAFFSASQLVYNSSVEVLWAVFILRKHRCLNSCSLSLAASLSLPVTSFVVCWHVCSVLCFMPNFWALFNTFRIDPLHLFPSCNEYVLMGMRL